MSEPRRHFWTTAEGTTTRAQMVNDLHQVLRAACERGELPQRALQLFEALLLHDAVRRRERRQRASERLDRAIEQAIEDDMMSRDPRNDGR